MTTIEIDGATPDAHRLWATTSSYGHFTAMQVRDGKTRGIALHLRRLDAASREAFGVGIDSERVRALIRHALGETKDASVRVYVFEDDSEAAVMVTVKPPAEMASPQRLQSARYQRPDPHIKHVTTDQGRYRQQAQRDGFDDALLTGADGVVSETSMANIGLFDRSGVVWPQAPLLHGITMQLLEQTLPGVGVQTRSTPVRVDDISAFEGAFLSNARGLAVVSQVDDIVLQVPDGRIRILSDAYKSVPWDTI